MKPTDRWANSYIHTSEKKWNIWLAKYRFQAFFRPNSEASLKEFLDSEKNYF